MLTDVACRTAKARDRDYKLSDHGGLFLFVSKTGFKSWRLKYRFAKSEKLLTIGPYPQVSLIQAREEREKAKKLLREGIDPSRRKKTLTASFSDSEATGSFCEITRDWYESAVSGWSPYYAAQAMRILNKDVLPVIGSMQISEIDTPLILQILRNIEQRGSLTIANLARIHISGIFNHAIYIGICSTNPAALVRRALRHHTTVNISAISE